jgi:dUTP pyrophosphatase
VGIFIVWTQPNCIFCDRAKAILTLNNQVYMEHDISTMRESARATWKKRFGTTPQVYYDGKHIGGYTELSEWANRNQTILPLVTTPLPLYGGSDALPDKPLNVVAFGKPKPAVEEELYPEPKQIEDDCPLLGINWKTYYAQRMNRDQISMVEAKRQTYNELLDWAATQQVEDMDTFDGLPIKRLSATARIPTRGTPHSVGYDLYADLGIDQNVLVRHGAVVKINTNIALAIPEGHYGRVAPRSGLGLQGIDVLAGVVDPDYRGEVVVFLTNHSIEAKTISHGDRVAQLILERCTTMPTIEMDDLPMTERGEAGFGSTGA